MKEEEIEINKCFEKLGYIREDDFKNVCIIYRKKNICSCCDEVIHYYYETNSFNKTDEFEDYISQILTIEEQKLLIRLSRLYV